jgi:acetoacetate decarboxylase
VTATVEIAPTRSVAGRLDVEDLPACQPAVSPLYPSFPWKSFNSRLIAGIYETDLDPVLDVLPPDLTPLTDPPQVMTLLTGSSELAIGGACPEATSYIPVLYRGEPHLYQWVTYLGSGSEERFAAGREVLGEPSKQAHVELRQEQGRGLVLGVVERPAGHRLMTIILGPLARQADESELRLFPVLTLRVVPSADGRSAASAQLCRRRIDTTIRRASDGSPMIFSGPATIALGHSVQDPVDRLPVRRVVGGYWLELGTLTQNAGTVVRSYV